MRLIVNGSNINQEIPGVADPGPVRGRPAPARARPTTPATRAATSAACAPRCARPGASTTPRLLEGAVYGDLEGPRPPDLPGHRPGEPQLRRLRAPALGGRARRPARRRLRRRLAARRAISTATSTSTPRARAAPCSRSPTRTPRPPTSSPRAACSSPTGSPWSAAATWGGHEPRLHQRRRPGRRGDLQPEGRQGLRLARPARRPAVGRRRRRPGLRQPHQVGRAAELRLA